MEKNAGKISISTVLLVFAVIIIIIMGLVIFKLNNQKNIEIQKSIELQAQVDSLNGTVSNLEGKMDIISDTINSNQNVTSNNTKDFNDIILDGQYSYTGDATDIIWNFSKDGKAALGASMYVYQGTYKTIKENYVEIHYTSKKVWDDELNYSTTETINEYEYISIEKDNKIYLIGSNGNKSQIERIGDIDIKDFE